MTVTADELYSDGRNRLTSETNIRNLTPGSIARALLQKWSKDTGEVYRYLDKRMLNAYVSTASGEFLKELGKLVGVTAKGTIFADAEVRFYINSELGMALSDVLVLLTERNGGTAVTEVTLPKGLLLQGAGNTYSLTEDAVITTGMTEVTAHAVCTFGGTSGNVEPGAITTIVWDNPILAVLNGIILVTNDSQVENGRNIQSTEELRYEITNAVTSSAKANDTAIRLACLSVPGVSEVQIINYSYGIGTFTVFVTTTSPLVTRGTLLAVQEAINATQAKGLQGLAESPTLIGVQAVIHLIFKPTTKAIDRSDITRRVQANVVGYINNLRAGEPLIINEMIQRIMETSTEIQDSAIDSIATGTYNLTNGTITDLDTTLLVANQKCDWHQKFVTSSSIVVCHV